MFFLFLLIVNIKAEQHEIVTISVQGTIFETTRQTLFQIPYFNSIGLDSKSNNYYMDRSAHVFKHILAWAVDNNYPYPYKYIQELNHFGIDHKDVNFGDNTCNIK